jgi:uncharacterized phage protein (TIGR01671 family)
MKNREIKFRGWDSVDKKMYTPFEFIKSGDNIDGQDWILWGETMPQLWENIENKNAYPRQRFEIMQNIGIKDCNEVEIYEGEIVRFGNIFTICYYDYCEYAFKYRKDDIFTYEDENGNYKKGWYSDTIYNLCSKYYVVGNIYENFNILPYEID